MALIDIISLGGTIACQATADGAGVVPGLTGADLVAAVPQVQAYGEIRAKNLSNMPSTEISFTLIAALVDEITALEAAGTTGVVVTQGTDTIEETSYLLSLLHKGSIPVVVTGAMRNPTLAGPDGPANLLAAVACAASPACRDLGAIVAFDDKIHAGIWVQKSDTSSTGAFTSPAPLGWIAEGVPQLYARPQRPEGVRLPAGAARPYVPILKPGLDDAPHLVGAALAAGAQALVLDLAGGGHLQVNWLDAVSEAAAKVPVIFASRTRGGRVLSNTYGQAGGEIDLIRRGLIAANDLDALKARLLLMTLLMAGQTDRFAQLSRLGLD